MLLLRQCCSGIAKMYMPCSETSQQLVACTIQPQLSVQDICLVQQSDLDFAVSEERSGCQQRYLCGSQPWCCLSTDQDSGCQGGRFTAKAFNNRKVPEVSILETCRLSAGGVAGHVHAVGPTLNELTRRSFVAFCCQQRDLPVRSDGEVLQVALQRIGPRRVRPDVLKETKRFLSA